MEEPELSVQVAENIYNSIEKYAYKTHSEYAKINRENIERRVKAKNIEKENAESNLTRFIENNRDFRNSPQLLLVYERYKTDVEIETQVYITLKQQLELAFIEEENQTSPVIPLDEAFTPVKVDSPSIYITEIIFLFIGLILSITALIYKKEQKYIKKVND